MQKWSGRLISWPGKSVWGPLTAAMLFFGKSRIFAARIKKQELCFDVVSPDLLFWWAVASGVTGTSAGSRESRYGRQRCWLSWEVTGRLSHSQWHTSACSTQRGKWDRGSSLSHTVPSATFWRDEGGTWPFPLGTGCMSDPRRGGRAPRWGKPGLAPREVCGVAEFRSEES